MARSRRRPEQNPEPEVVDDPEALEAAEAEVAELDEQDDETGTGSDAASDDARDPDAFDGFDDDITPRRSATKRPAEPRGRSRRAGAGAATAKAPSAEKGAATERGAKEPRSSRRTSIEVPDAAKDASATRTARARSSAEAQRARTDRRRVAAVAPNPAWLAPTAVGLLILGLVYLVTYYLSSAQLPLPIGDWNILVGFGIMIAGGGLLMRWK